MHPGFDRDKEIIPACDLVPGDLLLPNVHSRQSVKLIINVEQTAATMILMVLYNGKICERHYLKREPVTRSDPNQGRPVFAPR